jgi:uncharacterized protein YecT (DUF1311 family)
MRTHHLVVALAILVLCSRFDLAAADEAVGPSFDCAKADIPLARMICASPELSKIDLQFNQPYYAIRQQLGAAGRQELDEEDHEFLNSVQQSCGVPESGPIAGSPGCVGAQYNRKRTDWISRLNGTAFEEATRPIPQHIALQRTLQQLGFLPASAKIDGVYGGGTRAAIVAWQKARGRADTGLLGAADAAALTQEVVGQEEAAREADRQRLEAQRREADAARETERKRAADEKRDKRAELQQRYEEQISERVRREKEQGYKPISFDDFVLDRKELSIKKSKVAIHGFYIKEGHIELVSRTPKFVRDKDDDWIPILTEQADRDSRKFLLGCRAEHADCPVTLLGYISNCERSDLYGTKVDMQCLFVEDSWNVPEPRYSD